MSGVRGPKGLGEGVKGSADALLQHVEREAKGVTTASKTKEHADRTLEIAQMVKAIHNAAKELDSGGHMVLAQTGPGFHLFAPHAPRHNTAVELGANVQVHIKTIFSKLKGVTIEPQKAPTFYFVKKN